MAGTADLHRTQLAASELFSSLSPGALDQLAERVEPRSYTSGQVLFAEDEPGSSAHLVVRGRFRAERSGNYIGEIGRGEIVGEMSLLTGEARSATVSAVRDTQTLELSAEVFDDVLASHPGCYQSVSRQLVQRLQTVLRSTHRSSRAIVLAVLHDGHAMSREIVEQAIPLVGENGAVLAKPADDMAALEANHDVVVIVVGPDDRELRSWALGQSDRRLLVANAGGRPSDLQELTEGNNVELVLVHPPSTSCPSGTSRWLNALTVDAHHHVRSDRPADIQRVLRRLRNEEVVVVHGGGGARGAAHGGLHRALAECDVPVDAVVGVSAGAVAAVLIAAGHSPDESRATAIRLFAGSKSPLDFTLPGVSITTGARLNESFKDLVGEYRTLEDLWLPTTFVSSNLTTADIQLHQRGPVWRAMRATAAVPGVFPPVAEPEGLLVDGGLVANLPVDIARRLHPGATIIASDVGKRMELPPDGYPEIPEMSGWQAMRDRIQGKSETPGMVRLLAQLTALGGAGTAQSRGDLHIEFELDGFGMFDFKKTAAIVDAGYSQCRPLVQAWVDEQ